MINKQLGHFLVLEAEDRGVVMGLQAAGASILETLAGQRQQLQRTKDTNQQVQANLDKSQSILKRFW